MSSHALTISGALVVVVAVLAALRVGYGVVASRRSRDHGDFAQIIRKLNKIN